MKRGFDLNRRISYIAFLILAALPMGRAAAQPVPAPTPAEPPAAPGAPGEVLAPAPDPRRTGPSLSLRPESPQMGGLVAVPAETVAAEPPPTGEWKFDVTGYFRAPLRMSWGPATLADPNGNNVGTQLRTPPLVPDANYIDWRYTNSLVAPWTELNFHYGNDRAKATVQIASYNITDSGYRRLEANLGINQAYLVLSFPGVGGENGRLNLTVGGFTNRYGAAGRWDAGKYETYLFGRTHVAGETAAYEHDVGDWTLAVEETFGAKLEPIPFQTQGASWNPYPGPVPQESTFVASVHAGAVWKRTLIVGLHYINAFANDIERAGAYGGSAYAGRMSTESKPHIMTTGIDAKLLSEFYGDGYLGYSRLDAKNAIYIADAVEVLHSFGGWQLHDNYFGTPGGTEESTGTIDTILGQYVFSFGKFFRRPRPFWGDGPDLIASAFGMFNRVNAPLNPMANHSRLKFGGDLTYLPLAWLGIGGRFDEVQPNLDDNTQSFTVVSPRILLRTAFVTHEQVLIQYSRYFYNSNAAHASFPYSVQPGAAGLGADPNAFQIAAIIWF
jgi:hypothetical protein